MFDIRRCNDKSNGKNGVGGVGVDGDVDKFAHSQKFAVPIDDKKQLKIKIQPTYMFDTVQSITLKSFRKVVGYDTFESIKKKKRSQDNDASDYYNITVSFIVRRKSIDTSGNTNSKSLSLNNTNSNSLSNSNSNSLNNSKNKTHSLLKRNHNTYSADIRMEFSIGWTQRLWKSTWY
jgi:hypothetical protein